MLKPISCKQIDKRNIDTRRQSYGDRSDRNCRSILQIHEYGRPGSKAEDMRSAVALSTPVAPVQGIVQLSDSRDFALRLRSALLPATH